MLSTCPSRQFEVDDGIHPPYQLGRRPRSYSPVPARRPRRQEPLQPPSPPIGGSYDRTRGKNERYRPSGDTRKSASTRPRVHSGTKQRASESRARPSWMETQSAMSGGGRETGHRSHRGGVGQSSHRRGTGPSTQGYSSAGGGWMRSGL